LAIIGSVRPGEPVAGGDRNLEQDLPHGQRPRLVHLDHLDPSTHLTTTFRRIMVYSTDTEHDHED